MIASLVSAVVMILLTVCVHAFGLAAIEARLERWTPPVRTAGPWPAALYQVRVSTATVMALFVLHGIQIALYGVWYRAVGAIESWEGAFYFSASTFTTVGFGDLVLDERWRLFSAIESANGFLLIGWSTAFLVNVISEQRERA